MFNVLLQKCKNIKRWWQKKKRIYFLHHKPENDNTVFFFSGLFKSDDDDDNNNEENDQDNDNGIDNDIDNDVDNLSGNDSDYDDFGIFNITTPNYDDTKSALSSTALSPTNIILTKYHNALWRMMYYFTNLTIEILSSWSKCTITFFQCKNIKTYLS